MKIANKISLSFFVTAVILVGIVAPIVYFIAKSDLRNAIYAHLTTTAYSRGRHVETYLTEHKEQTMIIADSITIEDLVEALIEDSPDLARVIKEARTELKEYLIDQKMFYEVFIINRDGIIVLSTDEANIGRDKSMDAYFLGGKRGPYIKDAYYSETTKKGSIAISAPVLDDETRKTIGVVVTRFRLDGLNEITTERTGLGETGEIYLINKYGYMITKSRFIDDVFLKVKVDTENARACLWSGKGDKHVHRVKDVVIAPDYRGVSVLGAHYRIEEMDWGLLAEIDEEEAFAPLIKLKFLFITTSFLVPIIAWLIGIFISRLLTGPIRKLHKGVDIIGNGNLDHKVGTHATDEIGQLSMAFDKMTENLKRSTTSIDKLNQEITERKKAEDELKSANQRLEASQQQLRASNQQLRANQQQLNNEITERRKMEEKLKQTLEEAMESRGVMTSMLDDNNQIREELERKLQELKQVQDMVVQSEKLASLGNLVSDMAHEVNNPLMVISGRAQLSLMEEIKDKKLNDNLRIIVNQCEQAKDIIQRLLAFSKPSKGEVKYVNINDIVEFVIQLVEHQYSLKDIKFVRKFKKTLSVIKIDPKQMQEVFMNIIKNAAEAMPGQGSITVVTSEAKKFIKIEIVDTGEGISKEALKNIFDPFFTTKEMGTGLGLSVCYGIIKSHNGELKFSSQVGKGTTATITLPMEGAKNEV